MNNPKEWEQTLSVEDETNSRNPYAGLNFYRLRQATTQPRLEQTPPTPSSPSMDCSSCGEDSTQSPFPPHSPLRVDFGMVSHYDSFIQRRVLEAKGPVEVTSSDAAHNSIRHSYDNPIYETRNDNHEDAVHQQKHHHQNILKPSIKNRNIIEDRPAVSSMTKSSALLRLKQRAFYRQQAPFKETSLLARTPIENSGHSGAVSDDASASIPTTKTSIEHQHAQQGAIASIQPPRQGCSTVQRKSIKTLTPTDATSKCTDTMNDNTSSVPTKEHTNTSIAPTYTSIKNSKNEYPPPLYLDQQQTTWSIDAVYPSQPRKYGPLGAAYLAIAMKKKESSRPKTCSSSLAMSSECYTSNHC